MCGYGACTHILCLSGPTNTTQLGAKGSLHLVHLAVPCAGVKLALTGRLRPGRAASLLAVLSCLGSRLEGAAGTGLPGTVHGDSGLPAAWVLAGRAACALGPGVRALQEVAVYGMAACIACKKPGSKQAEQ